MNFTSRNQKPKTQKLKIKNQKPETQNRKTHARRQRSRKRNVTAESAPHTHIYGYVLATDLASQLMANRFGNK